MPASRIKPDLPAPLPPASLRPACDPASLGAGSSAELEPIDELTGQSRAVAALEFGTEMRCEGYNLFVLGPEGMGRHRAVSQRLEKAAAKAAAPGDWVYLHNFTTAWKPVAMRLPPGVALPFRDAMATMIDDLRSAIPAVFEGKDYHDQRRKIDEQAQAQQEEAFEALQEAASAKNIAILRTPMGFALAPVRDGKVMKPEVFNALPEAERKDIQQEIEALQSQLAEALQQMPHIEKQRRESIKSLNSERAGAVVEAAIAGAGKAFADVPAIAGRLADVARDLIENIELFVADLQGESESAFPAVTAPLASDPRFHRYMVNVVIANGGDDNAKGAPVIYEDHPALARLVGRIEHIAQLGALMTDFTMIRPGALHRANGGYLILDAHKLLREPWSWEAVKRALRSGVIEITSGAEQLSLVSTITLEPEPIPFDAKIVLIGERLLYYLLAELDPDFSELFKVQVEFDDEMPRGAGNEAIYARLVASIAARLGIAALKADGLAAVIDHAARLSDDTERLTLRMSGITGLLQEAAHWAAAAGHKQIAARDVERAVDEQTARAGRIRERSLEAIERDIVLIDTDGERIGQVNGLSVIGLGSFSFGRPSRITARVRMGTGKVIDIERESELGGPLHSKGMMILSGYLAATYATDLPMSLWASLVFEQSYGGVDGDSASAAELFALLSALAEVPIRQAFAVTGSINQLGEIQAIGGVNDKIEGFFDVCAARGLTGRQGVLIPHANVKHLMLHRRVVDAARKKRFAVYPIATVDQGIELLTGVAAGERGAGGAYPAASINARVEARLTGFAEARRRFAARDKDDGNG